MKKQISQQEISIVQRLEELVEFAGPDFVHQLIEVFFEMGRKDFDKMKLAFNTSSADAFMGAAHNLKATCLNLGASELGDTCQIAESHKTFHSKTSAQEVLSKIETQLKATEDFLRGYIKESHSVAG